MKSYIQQATLINNKINGCSRKAKIQQVEQKFATFSELVTSLFVHNTVMYSKILYKVGIMMGRRKDIF